MQDMMYDPSYVSDISQKMRVPERLYVDDGSGAAENAVIHIKGLEQQYPNMKVPGRIIVVEDDGSSDTKSDLQLLDVRADTKNTVDLPSSSHHVLATAHGHPACDDSRNATKILREQTLAKTVPVNPGSSSNAKNKYPATEAENELSVLHGHISKLTHRVSVLEREDQLRVRRERVLCVALLGYVIYKILCRSSPKGM